MGYYMRFFDTSDVPLTTDAIQGALKNANPTYRLEVPESAKMPQADLYLGDGLYGEIEINQPGDGLFDSEIQEMLEFLLDAEGNNRERVENVLRNSKRIISVRVLFQDRSSDETLAGIQPLWNWLFLARSGLLQADGEGYYDEFDLILKEDW